MGEIERDFGTTSTPPPRQWEDVAAVLQLFGYPPAEAQAFARPDAHWDLDLASDLSQAIFTSRFAVSTDWRYDLGEMLEAYTRALVPLDVRMTVEADDADDHGNTATVRCEGRGIARDARITSDPGRPDRVATQLHALMPPDLSFRRSRAYEQSDTLCEAVLPNDTWEAVRQRFGEFFDEIFVPADREPPGMAAGA